jgi:acetolactate synthase-1/2/3 large subunit
VEECRQQLRQEEEQNEALMNSTSVPVLYTRLCKEIGDFIDKDATVVFDGGEIAHWGIRSIKSYKPGHTLGVGIGNAWTLGVGTAFAMAARLARPDKQVLLLSGDGSFGLNAMEFNTMVSHNLPIVCVIGNDGAWGAIKRSQQTKGFKVIGTERSFVRYEKVVEALGGYGEVVEKPEDVQPALERAFASGLPACINVRCTSVPR